MVQKINEESEKYKVFLNFLMKCPFESPVFKKNVQSNESSYSEKTNTGKTKVLIEVV